MWVHVNHGDQGLRLLLERLCSLGAMLLLEPQPWACYGRAARRLRRQNMPPLPLLNSLKVRGDDALAALVDAHTSTCAHKVHVARTHWKRDILLFY